MAHTFTPLQRAWIDRLRAGGDPQAIGALTRISNDGAAMGHCCLGLACVVMIAQGIKIAVTNEWERRLYRLGSNASETALRGALGVPLGIRHPEGVIVSLRNRDGIRCSLSGLNDTGLTFPQIADIVEHFAEDLFEPTPAAA